MTLSLISTEKALVFLSVRDSRCPGFFGGARAEFQGAALPVRLGGGERQVQTLKSQDGGAGERDRSRNRN